MKRNQSEIAGIVEFGAVLLALMSITVLLNSCSGEQGLKVEAGDRTCGPQTIFAKTRGVKTGFGAEWTEGDLSAAADSSNYQSSLLDAPPTIGHEFRVQMQKEGNLEVYELVGEACFVASNDAEPGTYDVTIEIAFFEPNNPVRTALLGIPFQLEVVAARE